MKLKINHKFYVFQFLKYIVTYQTEKIIHKPVKTHKDVTEINAQAQNRAAEERQVPPHVSHTAGNQYRSTWCRCNLNESRAPFERSQLLQPRTDRR